MKISVIIPVLDEQAAITACLKNLQAMRDHGHEVIVVDGGSKDETLSLSRQLADRVLSSPAGRAVQMNAGAAQATGHLLLFLHADTYLPDDAADVLCHEVGQAPSEIWGRFDMRLEDDGMMFRVISAMMNFRSRMTLVATGDQAIFVNRQLFDSVGGYPQIPLMEDVAISKLLRKHVRPVCLKQRVRSSARRWRSRGVLRTIWLMWKLRLYYFLGVSPHRLARMYR